MREQALKLASRNAEKVDKLAKDRREGNREGGRAQLHVNYNLHVAVEQQQSKKKRKEKEKGGNEGVRETPERCSSIKH